MSSKCHWAGELTHAWASIHWVVALQLFLQLCCSRLQKQHSDLHCFSYCNQHFPHHDTENLDFGTFRKSSVLVWFPSLRKTFEKTTQGWKFSVENMDSEVSAHDSFVPLFLCLWGDGDIKTKWNSREKKHLHNASLKAERRQEDPG